MFVLTSRPLNGKRSCFVFGVQESDNRHRSQMGGEPLWAGFTEDLELHFTVET